MQLVTQRDSAQAELDAEVQKSFDEYAETVKSAEQHERDGLWTTAHFVWKNAAHLAMEREDEHECRQRAKRCLQQAKRAK